LRVHQPLLSFPTRRSSDLHTEPLTFFDSAGKYGAGLSLESLGKCLAQLGTDPSKVIISNKLGWYRVPLETAEPTFEPGVWKGLNYDAVQRISYDGIKARSEEHTSELQSRENLV